MEKRVESARSQSDGIIFYSNQVPMLGVRSYVTDDGRYVAGPTITIMEDIFGFLDGEGLMKYVLEKKVVILLNLLLLVLILLTHDFWLIFGAVYFIVFASKHMYQLIAFVLAIKIGEARSVGRFHSAEHMAVNAYNTLKRIPSFDEICACSRFTLDCGSRILIRRSLIYTIISLEIMTFGRMNGYVYLAIIIVTSIVIALFDKFKWYKFFQVLVTNKPSKVELMVAYKGIVAFDRMENDIENECCDWDEYGNSTITWI